MGSVYYSGTANNGSLSKHDFNSRLFGQIAIFVVLLAAVVAGAIYIVTNKQQGKTSNNTAALDKIANAHIITEPSKLKTPCDDFQNVGDGITCEIAEKIAFTHSNWDAEIKSIQVDGVWRILLIYRNGTEEFVNINRTTGIFEG